MLTEIYPPPPSQSLHPFLSLREHYLRMHTKNQVYVLSNFQDDVVGVDV